MTFDEMLPLLIAGVPVRCEDWGDNEFIWRCPQGNQYPEWEWQEHFKKMPLKEFHDRSIYDEQGNEVRAVTIIENVENVWELYEQP